MSALDDLKAAVEQTKSVEASAVTLIQGIATQLQQVLANTQNPDQSLVDLTTQLRSQTDALAAAITANTPKDDGVGDLGSNNLGVTHGEATGYYGGSGVGGAQNPAVIGNGGGPANNPANLANDPNAAGLTSTAPLGGNTPSTDASPSAIEADQRAGGTAENKAKQGDVAADQQAGRDPNDNNPSS